MDRHGISATLKAIKGSKDCFDYTFDRSGKSVETFASVWLGEDWKLYSTIALPSGVCLTGLIFSLPMPTHFAAFLQFKAELCLAFTVQVANPHERHFNAPAR
ncbi:hypothetical protein DFS34DRAFT_596482 [Phlyctochytrium arcticum]|nr:hypothetical protein DFS34DRAFT_596482 [Phlyctochytrium arcticum]